MKILKKSLNLFLVFVLLFFSFLVFPNKTEAKTLQDLKDELEKTKQEAIDNEKQKALTQQEINNVNANIALITKQVEEAQAEIARLNDEIVELNIKMEEKDKEIKKILVFLEISEGENAYLEYAFGAKSFTDFIYRMAVTEQLSDYNDKLIKEYNAMIEANKKKTEELTQKTKDLKVKQDNLNVELKKLGSKLSTMIEDYVDISESVKAQQDIINMYEKDFKCGLNDDISVCARNALPTDTTFWRPTMSGTITSDYGWRSYYGQGGNLINEFHNGIDIGMAEGNPVYAVANGTVGYIINKLYCGGNIVWITHRVNGQYYTSIYMHLKSINVRQGDVVTKDTIIGYSGGGPSTMASYGGWDQCTTGAHLHLTINTGRIGIDWNAWDSRYYSSSIDPYTVINFPLLYRSYGNRTSRY